MVYHIVFYIYYNANQSVRWFKMLIKIGDVLIDASPLDGIYVHQNKILYKTSFICYLKEIIMSQAQIFYNITTFIYGDI